MRKVFIVGGAGKVAGASRACWLNADIHRVPCIAGLNRPMNSRSSARYQC